MAESVGKFIKILKAELEDLLEDISVIERRAADRLANQEITEYVYKENENLLKQEAESISYLLRIVIDGIDGAHYKNLYDLTTVLDGRVREIVRTHDDPEAVYRFFARKLAKVQKYVESED